MILCFIIISKIIPSFLTVKKGSTFLTKPLFPQGQEDVTALSGYIFPTCSSPAEGFLIQNKDFPLTIKGKKVAGSAIAPPEFWFQQRCLFPKGLLLSTYSTELRLFADYSIIKILSICRSHANVS